MAGDGTSRRDKARLVGFYGFGALVTFVVVADRFAPIFFVNYSPIGDAALGLLLGAMTGLILTEAIDHAVGSKKDKE